VGVGRSTVCRTAHRFVMGNLAAAQYITLPHKWM
jgi:hypothetical protein